MRKINLTRISFGGASAIVTSTGLIIGFGAAAVSRSTIVAGLLIVGLADNVTDALSIHIYQEVGEACSPSRVRSDAEQFCDEDYHILEFRASCRCTATYLRVLRLASVGAVLTDRADMARRSRSRC